MHSKNIGLKIVRFFLTRMIVGILVVIGIISIGQFGIGKLLEYTSIEEDIRSLIIGILAAILALCSYMVLFRFYEKRTITELSTNKIFVNLIAGFFLGALLQSLTIFVIFLKGGFSFVSINPILFLLPSLTMAFTSSIVEEILVRGIIFRIMEEKFGSYLALVISALLFGAMHLANPNSSLTAAFGIAIQAGLLLAVAYIYSRNLWFPIAIHFAWNFTQSGIFGAIVSGNSLDKSLFTTEIQGEEWYTGGQFGPEGSIQATLFCLTATIVLFILSVRQNKIIKTSWYKSDRII